MANLEIKSVPIGADTDEVGHVETLVLGPKAFQAAESYVLSLFQLYPNVYLHKTTRAAEKVFCALMLQLIPLVQTGHQDKVGLPANHPICRFSLEPDKLENALALDDAIFWGMLPLMAEAEDSLIAECASRLRERRLPKCIDIRRWIEQEIPSNPGMDTREKADREAKIRLVCKSISERVEDWSASNSKAMPRNMVDQNKICTPYKKFQDFEDAF